VLNQFYLPDDENRKKKCERNSKKLYEK
jgi:hypothetical protein